MLPKYFKEHRANTNKIITMQNLIINPISFSINVPTFYKASSNTYIIPSLYIVLAGAKPTWLNKNN